MRRIPVTFALMLLVSLPLVAQTQQVTKVGICDFTKVLTTAYKDTKAFRDLDQAKSDINKAVADRTKDITDLQNQKLEADKAGNKTLSATLDKSIADKQSDLDSYSSGEERVAHHADQCPADGSGAEGDLRADDARGGGGRIRARPQERRRLPGHHPLQDPRGGYHGRRDCRDLRQAGKDLQSRRRAVGGRSGRGPPSGGRKGAVPEKGRVLGVDLGTRRVGLALTDSLRIVSSPLDTVPMVSEKDLVERLVRLCHEREVTMAVIGLPVSADGSEGPLCERARRVARKLGETGVPCRPPGRELVQPSGGGRAP